MHTVKHSLMVECTTESSQFHKDKTAPEIKKVGTAGLSDVFDPRRRIYASEMKWKSYTNLHESLLRFLHGQQTIQPNSLALSPFCK
eukprot:m.262619 g.262619  ORF g.262619 m.262619 type:complete len:86 (-) comp16222_c1_seq36:6248-6505(-)